MITVLVVDPPEGWRFGFPKIVPEWLKPEDMDAWIVQQGYPRVIRDTGCSELIYKLWYREVSLTDLPSDYYEENNTNANSIDNNTH